MTLREELVEELPLDSNPQINTLDAVPEQAYCCSINSEQKTKMKSATLFPILSSPTGMAKLAAEAQHALNGHMIEFKSIAVRSVLNRTESKKLRWMAYSINPYKGCEFGCKYCYARYTHEFLSPGLGTATDPYQPIERSAKVTRSILEVFARRAGIESAL